MREMTHNVSAPFVMSPRRYDTCQHWTYADRKLSQCGAPTENGRPTCDACKRKESQGHCGSNYRNYALIGRVSG